MRVPVGMAVDAVWGAVGCPSGVCNTAVGIEDLGKIWLLILNQFLQLGHLANLLECKDLLLLVAIYGEASGVVATVFETGEAVNEGVENGSAVLLDEVIDAVYISLGALGSSRITY
jgi:hypothetical protein